jgi:hypothetical protein
MQLVLLDVLLLLLEEGTIDTIGDSQYFCFACMWNWITSVHILWVDY